MKHCVAMTFPKLSSAFDHHIRSGERVNSTAMVTQDNLTEEQNQINRHNSEPERRHSLPPNRASGFVKPVCARGACPMWTFSLMCTPLRAWPFKKKQKNNSHTNYATCCVNTHWQRRDDSLVQQISVLLLESCAFNLRRPGFPSDQDGEKWVRVTDRQEILHCRRKQASGRRHHHQCW